MKKLRLGSVSLTFYSLLFFGFIYLPLAIVIIYSFNSNPIDMASWQSFTLDWYRGLFGLKESIPLWARRRFTLKVPINCLKP